MLVAFGVELSHFGVISSLQYETPSSTWIVVDPLIAWGPKNCRYVILYSHCLPVLFFYIYIYSICLGISPDIPICSSTKSMNIWLYHGIPFFDRKKNLVFSMSEKKHESSSIPSMIFPVVYLCDILLTVMHLYPFFGLLNPYFVGISIIIPLLLLVKTRMLYSHFAGILSPYSVIPFPEIYHIP